MTRTEMAQRAAQVNQYKERFRSATNASDKADILLELSTLIESIGHYPHLQDALFQQTLQFDAHHHAAVLWKENQQLRSLRAELASIQWPVIRQTDHPSTKRRKIIEAGDIAAALQEQVQNTVLYIQEGSKKAVIDSFLSLLEQIQDIAKAYAEHYSRNIEGKTAIFDILHLIEEIQKETERIETFLPEHKDPDPLEQMIGLQDMKTRMQELEGYIYFQFERKRQGFPAQDAPPLDLILTGNPGTGKTTLARIVAERYYEAGLLETSEVTEVHRGHLVGAYVGQSEEKTMQAIRKAQGGVLFIDEAYSLKRDGQSENDYGQAVIDTLVSAMTSDEFKGTFVVMLAGYPAEMRRFLWANPGLLSRFPTSNHFHVDDYTIEELLQIGEHMALQEGFVLDSGAMIELEHQIVNAQVDEAFGNARTVKQIIEDAVFKKGARTRANVTDVFDVICLEDQEMVSTNEASSSSALSELEQLIGLHEVKSELSAIQKLAHIQHLRKKRGLQVPPMQFHTVFTGPPGTGKTTVARLYARMLKETGMLKRGHLVTASRADLVAPYVGQTADRTRKKVREALGGVLFIDEAYALMNNSTGDYGKEAVDTLVEEMTRHNENLVIIMAGYSSEMNLLLHSNPGLSGRFKKHLHFPLYSSVELFAIFKHLANQAGYRIEEVGEARWLELFPDQSVKDNARWVENILTEAFIIQADRLASVDRADQWSDLDLMTLLKADVKAAIEKQLQEGKHE
ncbi:AAA family ATPase [Bacillaceae bacterium SIJ1]|uniref:AAA family ATPase n=1 Tax=Litoribacterium kuwaitense TaxID=1398745 RepID=UPI0013EB60DE|nr:AAA family ATPase [Litoribacterium kuwaitense]NGP44030.1 AAA family ATPase [Litoribacterium kuwaitense]